jgi:hypothetical protein
MSEGQDYLPEGVSAGVVHAYTPPNPGTGTVYVDRPMRTASGQRLGKPVTVFGSGGSEAAVVARAFGAAGQGWADLPRAHWR